MLFQPVFFYIHFFFFFFFNDTATTEIYTLSLHDALPIYGRAAVDLVLRPRPALHAEHPLCVARERARAQSGGGSSPAASAAAGRRRAIERCGLPDDDHGGERHLDDHGHCARCEREPGERGDRDADSDGLRQYAVS